MVIADPAFGLLSNDDLAIEPTTVTDFDDNGATSTATVTIEVDGLPGAVADSYVTDQGAVLTVAKPSSGVIGNDDQGDGPATVTTFDAASTGGGLVTMNPDVRLRTRRPLASRALTPSPTRSPTATATHRRQR